MAVSKNILIVGGSMYLGHLLRAVLAEGLYTVRILDSVAPDATYPGEEVMCGDLGDQSLLVSACRGCDIVVDFTKLDVGRWNGGELATFSSGVAHLWEAARIAGVKRVIALSSDSITGFYRRASVLDHLTMPRPDGPSGVVGALNESIASLYANKFGLEAMCIRMGACRPEPIDERMLSTWISPSDFQRLMRMAIETEYHFEIVYGVSANADRWWDNSNARRLGYRPQDRSDLFAPRLRGQRSANQIENTFQGGRSAADSFKGDPRRIT
ncbi:NAD-dependent epimerase/dehydratase family protein [Oryzibacter oryziterrae]|uniref:NAD-dependent epimerase/dehydratase family protein n=1 Tax=Oryzibacter oryziterrae TaxID=2766474 RepID=UPI001F3B4DA6|nr:NAD(P)-dependent oxidoreductase [Oryzibacter oryziterrae]